MTTITEQVKETLLGAEQVPTLSKQAQDHFIKHAKRDPQTGDRYLDEAAFIEAIAPPSEDYVGVLSRSAPTMSRTPLTLCPAQDKT
jgi:solute carrier family 25 (mitochondrial aspartate/glutamate transporter), member 12/13